MRRSRNSYIRSPRNVTRQPIGIPARSWNVAMHFFARVTTARWPAIFVSSSAATSTSFAFVMASPIPMLRTTFSTKFAVEGFSEALAAEMKPLGVHVTVIEPGPFRTDFLGRSGKLAQRELPEYAQTAGKARDYLRTQSGKQPGDPQKAVEALIAVANSPEPPVHQIGRAHV